MLATQAERLVQIEDLIFACRDSQREIVVVRRKDLLIEPAKLFEDFTAQCETRKAIRESEDILERSDPCPNIDTLRLGERFVPGLAVQDLIAIIRKYMNLATVHDV